MLGAAPLRKNMFWDNHLAESPESLSRLGGQAEGFSGKSEGGRLPGIQKRGFSEARRP